MKINVEEILKDHALTKVAVEHLAYSMFDVQSYDELTPKEKEIIPESSFNRMIQSATITYRNLKQNNPSCIILIRVGHFYNTYDDDAETVATVLGIALNTVCIETKKASIPRHAIDTYMPKLIRAGFKVAIHDNY